MTRQLEASVQPEPVAEPRTSHTRRQRRRERRWYERTWLIALALLALALLATFANAPGEYVRDNRFAFYWAPGQLLSRYASIWDASRGLGLMRWDFWPTSVITYVIRAAGTPAWATERIWHAIQLALGGTGMVVLLKLFRPRIGIEHVVAGLFYTFSPITVIFLLPSSLFLGYAFAPWLLVAFVHGARRERPLRWAAVFALIVFAAGNVNYPGFPGIALAALPIIPAAAYLVLVERSATWRRVGVWCAEAAALAILVSATALFTTYVGSAALSENLAKTETFSAISSNSSWSESWRGAGFWLVYLGAERPQAARYITSLPFVVATFVAPCIALGTLWLSRIRPRLLFASIMILGVAVMVGSYPSTNPAPYGRLLDNLFRDVGLFAGFRASYKASGALAMGVAALLGIAAASIAQRLVSRRGVRWIPAAAAILLVGVLAIPFWVGELYPPIRMTEIPRYWQAALSWLDRQPGEGRVLVLPSTVTAHYTWGSPGDDLFEGLLRRPHVMRAQLSRSQGSVRAADLVSAMGDYLDAAPYQAGSLAPIARRLGIRYVLIRNDLKWQTIGRPSPLQFDALRRDPDLAMVKSFGARGENVSPGISPEANDRLSQLPPVEVYEIRGWDPATRAAAGGPLIVAGDGAAWPVLAVEGLLDGTGPVRYTGDLTERQLAAALSEGARLVVSDTNRRRVESIPLDLWRGGPSYTLAAGEQLYRAPDNLFSKPASETVAAYADAKRIHATTYGSGFPPPETHLRPSMAFDGDLSTAWLGSTFVEDPTGMSIRVELRRPVVMTRLDIVAAPAAGGRRVSGARVALSDGTVIPVDLTRRRASATFSPRSATSFEVRVSRIRGKGPNPVGFSEISVPGLDLREEIRLPQDWSRAADDDPELAALLRSVPVDYLFSALPPRGLFEVEPRLRRRFLVVGPREFTLTGVVHLGRGAPEQRVAALVAPEAQADDVCDSQVVQVDGRPVPVRFVDDPAAMMFGGSVRFESCGPIRLGSGHHALESDASMRIERARLSTAAESATSTSVPVRARAAYSDDVHIEVDSPGRSAVILGQSYDRMWRATMNGRDLGPPVALDTMTGWIVDEPGRIRLHATVGAQRFYLGSLAITGLGVVLCAVLVARPGRRRQR